MNVLEYTRNVETILNREYTKTLFFTKYITQPARGLDT